MRWWVGLLFVCVVVSLVEGLENPWLAERRERRKILAEKRERRRQELKIPVKKPEQERELEQEKKHFNSTKYQPNNRIHIFYYGWYGSPPTNQGFMHWNHEILDKTRTKLHPPDDIGANFYPERGLYSSSDPQIIRAHMEELASIHVGVVVLSWYPPDRSDDQIRGYPGYCNSLVGLTLDEADKVGIQVAFLLEPYETGGLEGKKKEKTAIDFRKDITYILDNFKTHPAFYTYTKNSLTKPLFYIYDSYRTKSEEWVSLLGPRAHNPSSLRGTDHDAWMVGLALDTKDVGVLERAGFDGIFTYFASSGFTPASKPTSWKYLKKITAPKNLIFIPSVGPGYDDRRIRPWNGKNTKQREGGGYYDRMFSAAIDSIPDLISITSFNEWHEGTQIEPAHSEPPRRGQYPYDGYEDKTGKSDPRLYYEKTRYWAGRY